MGLNRRNVLVGLGGIVAGAGALVGTGAFTTVQAERTVNVETAGDEDAFLAIEPAQDSNGNLHPNAQDYVTSSGANGTIEINIGSGGADGEGVNLNAITHIDKVFQVTNNGTQDVVLYIEELPTQNVDDSGAIDIGALTGQLANTSTLDGTTQGSNAAGGDGIAAGDVVDLSYPASPEGYPGSGGYSNLGVLLGVGDTLELGVYIDTSDDNLNDGLNESGSSDVNADEFLLEDIALWANADKADDSTYRFEAA